MQSLTFLGKGPSTTTLNPVGTGESSCKEMTIFLTSPLSFHSSVMVSLHHPVIKASLHVHGLFPRGKKNGKIKQIKATTLGWLSAKESACQCRKCKVLGLDPWVGKIPQRRKWQPTPVFLLGKSHWQRSLVGYSPCGCKRVGHDLETKQKTITYSFIYRTNNVSWK